MEERLHKNNTAEKLQQELEMRGKYYFKGFGSLLHGVMADLDYFVDFKGGTFEVEKDIREKISRIIGIYQSIPFEQITDHPDYDLLSEINKLIFKLATSVEFVLSGGGVEESNEIIKK